MGASYVILIPWKQCYLIVPIVSKRTEHISAGALEIMLASYVAWSLESSANHSCHPFQYEESSTPWSSPNYHHTDQYLTVNIDVDMQICRDADMQICTSFPGSKVTHTKWSYRPIWVQLLSKCAPEVIARFSDSLTNWIMGVFYIPSEILSLCYFRRGDPSHEYMKQTNTLYIGCIFLGIRKKP